MFNVLGLIVIVLLLLFVITVLSARESESTMLTGFYRAGPEFCEESGLEFFLVRMGEGGSIRPGYILAKNSEGLIMNNPVKFRLSGGHSLNPGLCSSREYLVDIDWLDDEEPEFFPSAQTLHYYPQHGKLVFTIADEVFAVVYKDHALGDYNNLMPIDPMNDTEASAELLADLDAGSDIV